ncbi:hypothetical protein [Streptosporangium sp. NPDC020145]|uniref:hypothetical protein n=1 Tax=Streptosporangium sp. NPDC020145 TaxID=3154694 RepID=UPI0034474546
MAMSKEALAEELAHWWSKMASEEIDMVVRKAVEYGGNGAALDLIQIGQNLALTAGRRVHNEEATELGIYFYIVGKVARWTAAIVEGRRVSDDTILDLGIYTRMAARNREVGGWPFNREI